MLGNPFSRLRALPVFLGLAAVLGIQTEEADWAAGDGARPSSKAEVPVIALQQLASGLGGITSIVSAGDSRLFLTIQTGRIVIYDGTVLPTPFLDITSLVLSGGERGLLSVAFHPQYSENGFFFVYYTNRAGNIEIARLHRSASDPNAADPSSRAVLLTIPHPTNANHNGGQLQFGPDGYLYIGTGDGGSGNDPPCNAQNDNSPLGKMLRLDVDQNVSTSPFYGIPPSNPQAVAAFPRNLTWAKGLRNPWRFSFDRATGDLWIGDVGQGAWEEIDFQSSASAGGENYGWKVMEGNHCGGGGSSNCPSNPAPPPCDSPLYTDPLFEYAHGGGRLLGHGRLHLPRLAGSRARRDLPLRRLLLGPALGQRAAAHADRLRADDVRSGRGRGAVPRDRHGPPLPHRAPERADRHADGSPHRDADARAERPAPDGPTGLRPSARGARPASAIDAQGAPRRRHGALHASALRPQARKAAPDRMARSTP